VSTLVVTLFVLFLSCLAWHWVTRSWYDSTNRLALGLSSSCPSMHVFI
jgi:TRAP-type C4-dicarboxylate transport system permease small subunit